MIIHWVMLIPPNMWEKRTNQIDGFNIPTYEHVMISLLNMNQHESKCCPLAMFSHLREECHETTSKPSSTRCVLDFVGCRPVASAWNIAVPCCSRSRWQPVPSKCVVVPSMPPIPEADTDVCTIVAWTVCAHEISAQEGNWGLGLVRWGKRIA